MPQIADCAKNYFLKISGIFSNSDSGISYITRYTFRNNNPYQGMVLIEVSKHPLFK
jgi:hypothetical protein